MKFLKLMWSVLALQTIWCIFDNDAHRIVSKRGQEILNKEYDTRRIY
jgi:hypothetical protein